MDGTGNTVFNLFVIAFLLFSNGFFVASEFAMVKVRKTRIEQLVNEGNYNAKIAMEMNIGLNYMNIFILDNGDQIFFNTDGSVSSKTNKINTTDVMVDGLSVGEVKDMIISERQKMAEDGVVMLGIAISLANKKIVTQTDIQMRGCLYLKDSQDVIDTLTSLFVNTVKDSFETCKKAEEIELKVYEVIRKYMRKTLSKEPIISVSVIDLDRVKIL